MLAYCQVSDSFMSLSQTGYPRSWELYAVYATSYLFTISTTSGVTEDGMPQTNSKNFSMYLLTCNLSSAFSPLW